ncbi:hypothetical protein EDB83DRAFT_2326871 [Lactarius deliciosus]|nr:hypothetical protein EDB83DRAFT_2326871 [Lactarius deliciosus]
MEGKQRDVETIEADKMVRCEWLIQDYKTKNGVTPSPETKGNVAEVINGVRSRLREFVGGGDPAGVTEVRGKEAESGAFATARAGANANGLGRERTRAETRREREEIRDETT